MATLKQKIRILEAVVLENATFRQAGELVELSGARTGQNFKAICKSLGLPNDVDAVRDRADEVREIVRRNREDPLLSLSEPALRKLLAPSGYKRAKLSPQHLADEYASVVLRRFGPRVLLEVQDWLAAKGLAMKTCEATTKHDLEDVAMAVAVLRAYGIDVDVTRSTMSLWPEPTAPSDFRHHRER